jgi:hypothetical protein
MQEESGTSDKSNEPAATGPRISSRPFFGGILRGNNENMDQLS